MDKTGRFITKVFPWDGQGYKPYDDPGVPINRKIEITFAHHMKKDTVEDKSRVRLVDSETNKAVPGSVYVYNGPTRKLTIHSAHLEEGTFYEIIFPEGEAGPETIGGEYPHRTITYRFKTEGKKVSSESSQSIQASDLGTTEDKDSTEDPNTPKVLYDPFKEVTSSRVSLLESYPENGDLVEPNAQLVFVFDGDVEISDVEENIFVKSSKMSPLLESLQEDKLIYGKAEKSSGDGKSVFVITLNSPLETGQQYQVVIKKKLHSNMQNDIRITFHTSFERMFVDVDTVRLVLGRFADRLTDLELAKLINQQSNSVYQLSSMMDSFNEEDWVESGGVIIKFPYAAGQYVIYSTAYYAILGQSLETSSGISESIKLADLSVSGSSEVSDSLSDLLEGLKAEFERWWNVLKGEPEVIEPGQPNPNYSMRTTTRAGETSPYPDFHTRVPFEDIGGGGG